MKSDPKNNDPNDPRRQAPPAGQQDPRQKPSVPPRDPCFPPEEPVPSGGLPPNVVPAAARPGATHKDKLRQAIPLFTAEEWQRRAERFAARQAAAASLPPLELEDETATPDDIPRHGLSLPQENAIQALLEGETITEAAVRAGVSRRTLQRWHKLPAFQAAFRDARQMLFDVGYHQLLSLAGRAVECVSRAMKQGDQMMALDLLKNLRLLDQSKDRWADPFEEESAADNSPGKPQPVVAGHEHQQAEGNPPASPEAADRRHHAPRDASPHAEREDYDAGAEACPPDDQPEEEELSPRQEIVAQAILAGERLEDAAAQGKCSQRTVLRWLHDDDRFRRALNRRRRDCRRRIQLHLAHYVQLAIQRVRISIEAGDPRVAWALLKGLGLARRAA